jgi:hypothetical protein
MRAVAERLAECGLTVHGTEWEDSRLLKVTSTRGARCLVNVEDGYSATCEYIAVRSESVKPAQTARVVARMLGADYTDPEKYAVLHQGVTPAGAVGRDMKARGFTVDMDVIEDREIYRAFADVVITSPGKPERGKVHIGDDSWVYWECYSDELPGGVADLAGTIADILTPPLTPRNRLWDCLHRLSIHNYMQTRANRRHRQTQP